MPVRISASRLLPYRLPLRAAWASARGGFAFRRGWLLKLESDAGLAGYGDCAPLPMAGTEASGDAEAHLARWRDMLAGMALEQALARLQEDQGLATAARCAVETALLDLLGQESGVPLARLLDPDASRVVRCNAALGALGAATAERARQAVGEGFDVLKIKLGLTPAVEELARLHELAATLPAGVRLRLDANLAWSRGEAERFLDGLAEMPVEMVEEPLAHPDVAALRELQRGAPVPLALDESFRLLGPEWVLAAAPVRRLVLKPMVWGGAGRAFRLARLAREAGMECVVTTTVDSAAGTRVAAHLAAAVGNGLAHGLATSSWLERDVGRPPPVIGGALNIGDTPGLGFEPFPEGGMQ